MSGLEVLAVLAAGLGAGILTSTVGVASLVSFPVLLAVGLPPVLANVSNTIGMAPAGLSGSLGYRHELREAPRTAITVAVTCVMGGLMGSVLLLALDPAVFEVVVPWLILGTCLLVGVQPRLTAWLRQGGMVSGETRTRMSPLTTFFAAVSGVYGGYFGAGAGVMMVAVLGLGLDLEFRIINALKTLAVLCANLSATVIFVVVAEVDWTAAGLLAAGSLIGGYLGARVARYIPAKLFRALIVVAGVIAAVSLLRQ